MRPSCVYCARKHLGQASVLLDESRLGYPDHLWLAIGHLAEAESELLRDHPQLAEQVRAHRKRLEAEPSYVVPVLDLISAIGKVEHPSGAPQIVIRDHTVVPEHERGSEIGTLPSTPCLPCEEAKRKGRIAATEAECALMGEGKPYRGRLVIIAPLSNFEPSYSLCSVILEQSLAARLAGFRVHVWVNEGCDVSKLHEMPPGLTIEGVLPKVTLKEDEINPASVTAIADALKQHLKPMYAHGQAPCVLTHDLVFQAWYIDFAAALHQLASLDYGNGDGSRWWHMIHSSVGSRPPEEVAKVRATLPAGHRLLAVNYADVPFLRGYYQVPAGSDLIDTLLNPKDPRAFMRMPAAATLLITKHQLLLADVVQVYPLSGTRMLSKGMDKLLGLFAALHRAGAVVRLVVVNAHSNNDDAKHAMKHLRSVARTLQLPEECLIFTSEELPDTVVHGLDGDAVRSLFAISNLFAFPTLSEAGPLVLLEAIASQCLLVLNDSLPCLADYVPRNMAIWVPWGSLKGVAQAYDQDLVAAQIIDRLQADERLALRAALFRRSGAEGYGQALAEILERKPRP